MPRGPRQAPPPRQTLWSYLGRVPYGEAFRLQVRLRDALGRGEGGEHLLLLEHPHVFTLGRSASRGDIVAADSWLAERGVEVVESDRGGQVTYHGPGQLVGYPILDLSPDRRDARRYVRDLQEVLIRSLAELGVEGAEGGEEAARIGVWVEGAKVASIGVHLSRWLTTHGFALNLAPDLEYFQAIVPCGLTGVRMTSVERLIGRRPPAVEEVAALCARHFAAVFGRDLRPAEGVAAGVGVGAVSYRIFDHTADLGIEVRAADREALFAEAVPAMTDCFTEVEGVRPQRSRDFRLRATALDLLLVDWLDELLAALEVDGEVYRRARVEIADDGGELELRAAAEGEAWDPERHPVKVQLKGVTYHGLEVARDGEGWRARVIFDI